MAGAVFAVDIAAHIQLDGAILGKMDGELSGLILQKKMDLTRLVTLKLS